MDAWKIIAQLMGLQDLYFINVRLFHKSLTAAFKVRYEPKVYHCRHCKSELSGIHDWQDRHVMGPPMGPFFKVQIHLLVPRAYCKNCGCVGADVPFIHDKIKSMTCGLAEVAGRFMEETTCAATSRLLHQNAKKLWSLDQHRMQLLLTRFKLPDDLDVSYLSADEVHHKTVINNNQRFGRRWNPLFITNLVCHKNGKILFNGSGRDSRALEDSLSVLSPGQKLAVEYCAVDLHDPFIQAIKKHLPNAQVCIDRFHLVQNINKCIDAVRKEEFKKAQSKNDIFTEGMLSPSRRFVLMERSVSLGKQDFKMLKKLRDINQNIHNSMLLIETFHNLLECKTIKLFRSKLLKWYLLVRESKLKSFIKFTNLIRKYRSNIEAFIESRLTTAVSEGINNAIKTLKKSGYGYPNQMSFRMKCLQRHGFLNHYAINTDDLLFKVTDPI